MCVGGIRQLPRTCSLPVSFFNQESFLFGCCSPWARGGITGLARRGGDRASRPLHLFLPARLSAQILFQLHLLHRSVGGNGSGLALRIPLGARRCSMSFAARCRSSCFCCAAAVLALALSSWQKGRSGQPFPLKCVPRLLVSSGTCTRNSFFDRCVGRGFDHPRLRKPPDGGRKGPFALACFQQQVASGQKCSDVAGVCF